MISKPCQSNSENRNDERGESSNSSLIGLRILLDKWSAIENHGKQDNCPENDRSNTRCCAHLFTFSPTSSKRRMASPLVIPSLLAQLSSTLIASSGMRAVTTGLLPVAGRPRGLFLFDVDRVIF